MKARISLSHNIVSSPNVIKSTKELLTRLNPYCEVYDVVNAVIWQIENNGQCEKVIKGTYKIDVIKLKSDLERIASENWTMPGAALLDTIAFCIEVCNG